MTETLRMAGVRYVGPIDAVEIRDPATGVPTLTVGRGQVIQVSSAMAGTAPGAWVDLKEATDGHDAEVAPDGHPQRVDPMGGGRQHRTPGAGLLAQEGVWEPVAKATTEGK